MCGITALLGANVERTTVERMTREVAHRGPDGECVDVLSWSGASLRPTPMGDLGSVGLGHRRLSVLDLSQAARQPMSLGGDLWMVYNGEIYNYVEIRAELSALGHSFRSQGDTEVLLRAYHQWGSDCFAKLRGMWALVIVDGKRKKAVLSRDRMGIKPLYYARATGTLALVSEIKQLRHVPGFSLRPSRGALLDYLATGYEDASRTFFEDVVAFPAAAWAELDLDTLTLSAPVSYWHPEEVRAHVNHRDEAAEVFCAALRESVSLHLRSDVPVGCALSGGLDSSSVAAFIEAERVSQEPLHAFIATFPDDAADERQHADVAAKFVGAEPHYVEPSAEDFLQNLRRFVWLHDEPVGAFAQYGLYCVSRITRAAGVPVTLNGQGGDELLAGYWQSYAVYLRQLLRQGRVVDVAKHVAGSALPGGNPLFLKALPWLAKRYFEKRRDLRRSRRQQGGTSQVEQRMDAMLSMPEHERRVYDVRELFLPRLLKWDDRNFMGHGVEGRYPFLDHRVIEAALSCALETFYDRGWTKEPIRRGMHKLLPPSILRRRDKVGFETPQDRWMRGPLKQALETTFGNDDAPLWDYAQRDRVRSLLERTDPELNESESGQTLLRAFMAEHWLRIMIEGEGLSEVAPPEPSAS